MGRETVKKLQDVRASAAACGVDLAVPDNRVDKVGEFRRLALLAEADGHLRQRLQQVLKLSKEKWEEARDHAMRAVVADSRMRIWYADKVSWRCGLGCVEEREGPRRGREMRAPAASFRARVVASL